MKLNRITWLCFSLLIFVSLSFAQMTNTEYERERLRRETERADRRREADLERRMRQMRNLETMTKTRPAVSGRYDTRGREEWRKRISEIRKVPQSDLDLYRDFLRQDKTGIFRLMPNFDCLESKVMKVDGDCAGFIPETSDFSFRTRDYATSSYHDIGYNNGTFVSDAFFAHGLLASLGEVPIEALGVDHPGVGFLRDFKPASDLRSARTTADLIAAGVESEGNRFAGAVEVKENTTYVLRQIAYRADGSFPRYHAVQTRDQLRFLSLSADKRDDIMVAFRVVKKDADGTLTLLWKELARSDAPKLKFAKGEPVGDFKPASGERR